MKFAIKILAVVLMCLYTISNVLYIRSSGGGAFGGRSAGDYIYLFLILLFAAISLAIPKRKNLVIIISVVGILIFYLYNLESNSDFFNNERYFGKGLPNGINPAPIKNYIIGISVQVIFLALTLKNFITSNKKGTCSPNRPSIKN